MTISVFPRDRTSTFLAGIGAVVACALVACRAVWGIEDPDDAVREDAGLDSPGDAGASLDGLLGEPGEGELLPPDGGGTEPDPPGVTIDGGRWCDGAGTYRLCRDFDGPLDASDLWTPSFIGGDGGSSPLAGFAGTNGWVSKVFSNGSALLYKDRSIAGNEVISFEFKLRRATDCTSAEAVAYLSLPEGYYDYGSYRYKGLSIAVKFSTAGRYFARYCVQSGAPCFYNEQNDLSPSLTNTRPEASEWMNGRLAISPTAAEAAMNSSVRRWVGKWNLGTSVGVTIGVLNGAGGCEWVFDNVLLR